MTSLSGAMSPVRPASPAWITLAVGQSLSFGELVMTPWGVASGHITVHGQPASSNGIRTWTSVNLYYQVPGSADWTNSGFARTDADGNYRLTTVPRALGGLTVGRYMLTAEPVNTDQVVSLTFDDISSSMDIDLPFVSRVSGTVYNGPSPTVANEVNLTFTNGSTTLTTTTDGNGSYLFNDVPNGTWHLTAAYDNGGGDPVSTTVALSSDSLDIPTTTVPRINLRVDLVLLRSGHSRRRRRVVGRDRHDGLRVRCDFRGVRDHIHNNHGHVGRVLVPGYPG